MLLAPLQLGETMFHFQGPQGDRAGLAHSRCSVNVKIIPAATLMVIGSCTYSGFERWRFYPLLLPWYRRAEWAVRLRGTVLGSSSSSLGVSLQAALQCFNFACRHSASPHQVSSKSWTRPAPSHKAKVGSSAFSKTFRDIISKLYGLFLKMSRSTLGLMLRN